MSNSKDTKSQVEAKASKNQYSLNDDRRVKTLSPGALIAKRFFRNRLAVVGLVMLVSMFVFSFIGGAVSPYEQDQRFSTYSEQTHEFAGVTENKSLRFTTAPGAEFGSILQGQMSIAARGGKDSFSYNGVTYQIEQPAPGVYLAKRGGRTLAVGSQFMVNPADGQKPYDFDFTVAALCAQANAQQSFSFGGKDYQLDETGNMLCDGQDAGYVSQFVVSAADNTITISRDQRETLLEAVKDKKTEVPYKDAEGNDAKLEIRYNPSTGVYSVTQSVETYVYSRYEAPSSTHWLGTDTNGMDMLTRLMYGGRVSLVIGFIVVIIAGGLGILLGGLAGYFGGWVDNLIMRVVDVFYCIPSMPIVIILGSTMDAMQLDPQIRMLYLMLVLGLLSWAGIARLVRGQILSLREQEFMVAAEACGISVRNRIFKHLIPNVMPQLIVNCTMMLGSTIITEATLSFLGLGVKFPFASWGNIINDVNNAYVLTNYWFIWIPAGICLLITVLGFNFVGDGLRDAFDPKMNR